MVEMGYEPDKYLNLYSCQASTANICHSLSDLCIYVTLFFETPCMYIFC